MQWHISLLGGLRAEQKHQAVTRFRTQKTGALLAYLAYYLDRLHPRDVLADLLWPEDDQDAARASFRTALNSLRKQLEPPGAPPNSVLSADRFHVHLRSEAVTTDVGHFLHAIQEARSQTAPREKAAHLARAVQAYTGELLPGYYEDWVVTERHILENAYTEALRQLVAYSEGVGDLTQALEYAARIVAMDPTAEEAHMDVIRLFRKAGRPREALRQYDTLERTLQSRLQAEPTRESRALAESIRETLARPVTVRRSHRHAVRTPLVRKEFPAQRREAAFSPSLPVPAMPFFGRDTDITHITGLLHRGSRARFSTLIPPDPPIRLLTLLGPGGSGKTRLAIEVARHQQRSLEGKVWFVSLADLSEPQAIPDAVLDVMGLSRSVDAPWFAAIQTALADRPGLLVLDNFEHLIEGGTHYVQDLLAHLPALTCLTTSRLKLDIEGERVVLVAPLPFPEKGNVTPETLSEFASIRLFLDRAQAVRTDFQLTARNADAVAELCRRLEGLPLALELAASWAQIFTPHQMLERLSNPLDLSARRKRENGGRHESLRATVEWSYRLLSPEQQALFRRLSVFRGGWNLAAAFAICFEGGQMTGSRQQREETMLRDLTLLAESSLILTEEVTLESGPEIRFLMLETLREYGAELLSPEEKRLLNDRHTAYFSALIEAYSADFQLRNRDRLDPDLDNLRTALLWSAENPDRGEQTLRMTVAMFGLWNWWGHQAEAREWVERFLNCAPPDSPLLAEALNVAGGLCFYMEDGEASLLYQRRHLEVRRRLNNEIGIARALCNIGLALQILDRSAEALPLHEESYAIFRRLEAVQFLPAAMLNLGNTLHNLGEYARSRELLWEALRGYEQIGHRSGVGLCYHDLGLQAELLGELSEAQEMFEAALSVYRAIGSSHAKTTLAKLREVQAVLARRKNQAD